MNIPPTLSWFRQQWGLNPGFLYARQALYLPTYTLSPTSIHTALLKGLQLSENPFAPFYRWKHQGVMRLQKSEQNASVMYEATDTSGSDKDQLNPVACSDIWSLGGFSWNTVETATGWKRMSVSVSISSPVSSPLKGPSGSMRKCRVTPT